MRYLSDLGHEVIGLNEVSVRHGTLEFGLHELPLDVLLGQREQLLEDGHARGAVVGDGRLILGDTTQYEGCIGGLSGFFNKSMGKVYLQEGGVRGRGAVRLAAQQLVHPEGAAP